MPARQAAGAAITVIGLILLLYGIAYGAVNHKIGSYATLTFNEKEGKLEVAQGKPGMMDRTAAAIILGWFLVLIGPAIWQGEVPATIKSRVEQG